MFEELTNQFNVFDWIFIIWMGFSILLGLMRGFVAEMLSLVGWVIAFFLASHYGADAGKILPLPIKEEVPTLLIGFLIVFVGSLILWTMFRIILNFAIGKGPLDYILGLIFGALRGVLVPILTLSVIGIMISLPNQSWWENAYFRNFLEKGIQQFDVLMPVEWKSHLKSTTESEQAQSLEAPSTTTPSNAPSNSPSNTSPSNN